MLKQVLKDLKIWSNKNVSRNMDIKINRLLMYSLVHHNNYGYF